MSAAPTRPADRYGDAGPGRRRARVAALVALVVALTAWVVWVGVSQASGRVDEQVQGYDVVDDGSVVVTFSVTKPADATVTCRVEALSSTQARVGLAEVAVTPADGVSSVHTVTVRTQQRAVTGVVDGCSS